MSDQPEVLQIASGTKPGSCCGAEEGGPPTARDNPQTIRTEVQNYYGEVAELQLTGRSQSDCCGSDLYGGEDLSLLPDTAVQSSRGCGNPHAIASLQPGEIVLDLGSGGGLDVLLAARQVGEDGYVYGVDMTDSMLELARGNAEKVGATKVEFRKGDLEDLPLNADSVDVIISNCVVNLTPDKGKALHEAFRVLKPWGRLAISDIVVDGDLNGLPVTEEQIRAGLSWAGCIAGALTVTELTNLLHDAGFEDIAITVVHRYSAADFLGDLPSALTDLQPPVLQDLSNALQAAASRRASPASEPVLGHLVGSPAILRRLPRLLVPIPLYLETLGLPDWQIGFVLGAFGVSFGALFAFLPLLAERKELASVGAAYGVCRVSIIATRILTGRLLDRYNRGQVIFPPC